MPVEICCQKVEMFIMSMPLITLVINGMDILACMDAMRRAAELCRKGEGPVMLEFDTYRNYGHSLGDPRNEYRTKEEEAEWKALDPIANLERQMLENGCITPKKLADLKAKVADRNARMAAKAAWSQDPDPADVIKYMYTDTRVDTVPEEFATVKPVGELPVMTAQLITRQSASTAPLRRAGPDE